MDLVTPLAFGARIAPNRTLIGPWRAWRLPRAAGIGLLLRGVITATIGVPPTPEWEPTRHRFQGLQIRQSIGENSTVVLVNVRLAILIAG